MVRLPSSLRRRQTAGVSRFGPQATISLSPIPYGSPRSFTTPSEGSPSETQLPDLSSNAPTSKSDSESNTQYPSMGVQWSQSVRTGDSITSGSVTSGSGSTVSSVVQLGLSSFPSHGSTVPLSASGSTASPVGSVMSASGSTTSVLYWESFPAPPSASQPTKSTRIAAARAARISERFMSASLCRAALSGGNRVVEVARAY